MFTRANAVKRDDSDLAIAEPIIMKHNVQALLVKNPVFGCNEIGD